MAKTFAIADLHGRKDLLDLALAKIEKVADGGTVVFLGDYVDRGPDSRGVVQRLVEGPSPSWKWVCLMGNHEDMMIDTDLKYLWEGNGGKDTIKSYRDKGLFDKLTFEKHKLWLSRLRPLYSDVHRVYVHAYVSEFKELAHQKKRDLFWERYGRSEDRGWRHLHVVHGHTPYREGPMLYSKRTNLDTAAVYTGRLVVAQFDDDKPGGPEELYEIYEQRKLGSQNA